MRVRGLTSPSSEQRAAVNVALFTREQWRLIRSYSWLTFLIRAVANSEIDPRDYS